MLSSPMLNAECPCAACPNAEICNTDCHHAECHCAQCSDTVWCCLAKITFFSLLFFCSDILSQENIFAPFFVKSLRDIKNS
jgi:hypothetical protein